MCFNFFMSTSFDIQTFALTLSTHWCVIMDRFLKCYASLFVTLDHVLWTNSTGYHNRGILCREVLASLSYQQFVECKVYLTIWWSQGIFPINEFWTSFHSTLGQIVVHLFLQHIRDDYNIDEAWAEKEGTHV